MTDRIEKRLQTDTKSVESLVDEVRRGVIRVPAFQRPLRWGRGDVIKLFDSILRGYPIGNLLLWRRAGEARETLRIGALSIDAPATENALFVVDGQQRLTSLASALSPEGRLDPKFNLAYDLQRETFVPAVDGDPTIIPLSVIFDLPTLLSWYSDHPSLTSDPSLINKANKVATEIRQFRVPTYVVEDSDEDVLKDIFDRMNNYGTQMKRAEVFSALNDGATGERIADAQSSFAKISEEVHAATDFGLIDEDTTFLCFLARRGADVGRDIRREFVDRDADMDSDAASDFPTESPEDAYRLATQALITAVTFVQTEAGVPHFALLPYRYLLVVLTRFFGHFPVVDAATRRNLRRWFWRASIRGPEYFKGSSTGAIRSLNNRIVPGGLQLSVGGLLAALGEGPWSLPQIDRFKANYSSSRMLLLALWSNKPMKLHVTGEATAYSYDELLAGLGERSSAVEMAVPLIRDSRISSPLRAMASNRILLPDAESSPLDSPLSAILTLVRSSSWGQASAEPILKSHLIDDEAAELLLRKRYESFLEHRQTALKRLFDGYLRSKAEWQHEDTPPLDSLLLDDLDDSDLEPRDDEFLFRDIDD